MLQTITEEYQHCLVAYPCSTHPVNGNVYITVNGKVKENDQHVVIHRLKMDGTLEVVASFLGGGVADSISPSFVAMGGAIIRKDGALVVALSAPTTEQPNKWLPRLQVLHGIDDPWSPADMGIATPVGSLVLPADNPVWQLWRGTYLPEHFDTDIEEAIRVGRAKDGLIAVIDALVSLGLIKKG